MTTPFTMQPSDVIAMMEQFKAENVARIGQNKQKYSKEFEQMYREHVQQLKHLKDVQKAFLQDLDLLRNQRETQLQDLQTAVSQIPSTSTLTPVFEQEIRKNREAIAAIEKKYQNAHEEERIAHAEKGVTLPFSERSEELYKEETREAEGYFQSLRSLQHVANALGLELQAVGDRCNLEIMFEIREGLEGPLPTT